MGNSASGRLKGGGRRVGRRGALVVLALAVPVLAVMLALAACGVSAPPEGGDAAGWNGGGGAAGAGGYAGLLRADVSAGFLAERRGAGGASGAGAGG